VPLADINAVQQHQNNHLRIEALRGSIANLDGKIKDTLLSLASTRRDMTTTATTSYPDGATYSINYEELLSYAKRISKTTLPPPGVSKGVDLDTSSPTPQDTTAAPTPADGATPMPLSNGMQTPTPMVQHVSQLSEAPSSQLTALPPTHVSYMNPYTGQIFTPWPQVEQVRMGSLAGNQSLADQGIEIRGYDPAVAQAEADAARAAEAERQAEEERVRAEEVRARAAAAAEARAKEAKRYEESRDKSGKSTAAPASSGQFQFMTLDDDEDDE
jgi:hypothetical protein